MKKYLKPISYILFILLFLNGIIWTLRFAHQQYAKRVCNAVKISIDANNSEIFITENEIADQLSASNLYPEGDLTNVLNTHAIEKQLSQNSAIQDVNVFSQLSGEMNIEVMQRTPIVRVENAKRQQFYICSDGCLMNTNPAHTAYLLVANGHISESFSPNQNVEKFANDTTYPTPTLNKIFQITTFIRNNEFLNTLIDQIYINEKQEFELVPKVGNQLILLGNAENYEDQFKRLEQFYTHGLQKAGWDAYKIINLKYNNQVVCTKV
ncbi:MAG: hypothetical protein LBU91_01035 [Bacteroidales bacterium]|jgi:cell division protein FtsQ|nr:hypothetical protein [Bacteroidales bacterium]